MGVVLRHVAWSLGDLYLAGVVVAGVLAALTMTDLREKWDQRYAEQTAPPVACSVLLEQRALLPATGTALDLACGRGGNALLLADAGLTVTAWDLSPVAIDYLRQQAKARGAKIHAEIRDVIANPPAPDSFDVIVVSYFLERALMPALISALRPGGLLFYQTFGHVRVENHGPSNPLYRLQQDELLSMLASLQTRLYRATGLRGEVMYVGARVE